MALPPRARSGTARRRSAAVLLLVLLACWPAARALACDPPPPPVRDLTLERYYADEAGSVTDPARFAAHQSATAPVRGYLKTVVRDADASLRATSPALAGMRAACALEWLEGWAKGGALLGAISGKQSEAERRWTLAGAALAYLKVRNQAAPGAREAIETWLVSLAAAADAAFAASGAKRNNHYYWLGLGLAATGLAAGKPEFWNKARAIMQNAAAEIGAGGTLPLELARGRRALHYHAFALMPLVTMTALARARGEDWAAFGDGALARLVTVTSNGLADPFLFDRLAGERQERPVKPGAGWMALYAAMDPGWLPPMGILSASGHRSLGGNVLLLRRALGEQTAPERTVAAPPAR